MILNKVKTVDGPSSGLSADVLDGEEGSYYTGLVDNANGFNLDPNYYYYRNTKFIFSAESDESWAAGRWTASGGSFVADTVNYKVGTQSIKITGTSNTQGAHLVKALDLTKFNDGSASTTADFIECIVYIDATSYSRINNGIAICFYCDAEGTDTNAFNFFIPKANIGEGYNYIKRAKSSNAPQGAPDWASVDGVGIWVWGTPSGSAEVNLSWDACRMTRADPTESSIPNIFQRQVNGVWQRDFALSTGLEFFVGLENNKIVCKLIAGNDNYMIGTKLYNNFIINGVINASTASETSTVRVGWMYSGSWSMYAQINTDALRIGYHLDGAGSSVSPVSFPINYNDIINFKIEKSGNLFSVSVYKNNDLSTLTMYTVTLDHEGRSGYLAMLLDADYSGQYIEALSITTSEQATNSMFSKTALDLSKAWLNWTPTFTWGTATPEGSVSTRSRYNIFANTCHFNVYYSATDGNDSTSLTVSLPKAPKNNGAKFAVAGYQKVNATWTQLVAYINDSASTIQFLNFQTCTNAAAVEIMVTGFYEV